MGRHRRRLIPGRDDRDSGRVAPTARTGEGCHLRRRRWGRASLRAAIESASREQLKELLCMLLDRVTVADEGSVELEPVPAARPFFAPRESLLLAPRTGLRARTRHGPAALCWRPRRDSGDRGTQPTPLDGTPRKRQIGGRDEPSSNPAPRKESCVPLSQRSVLGRRRGAGGSVTDRDPSCDRLANVLGRVAIRTRGGTLIHALRRPAPQPSFGSCAATLRRAATSRRWFSDLSPAELDALLAAEAQETTGEVDQRPGGGLRARLGLSRGTKIPPVAPEKTRDALSRLHPALVQARVGRRRFRRDTGGRPRGRPARRSRSSAIAAAITADSARTVTGTRS